MGYIQILRMQEIHSLFLGFQRDGRHGIVERRDIVVPLHPCSREWHTEPRSHLPKPSQRLRTSLVGMP